MYDQKLQAYWAHQSGGLVAVVRVVLADSGRETHTTHTTTHCTLHTCRVLLMLPVVLNVRWTGRWSLRLISQCIVTVTAQEGQLQWYLSAPHPTLGCMRQCCASVGERYFDQRASVPVRVSLGQCHNGCEWPCKIVTQSLTHCVQVYAGRVGGTVYNTRTGAQVLRYQQWHYFECQCVPCLWALPRPTWQCAV